MGELSAASPYIKAPLDSREDFTDGIVGAIHPLFRDRQIDDSEFKMDGFQLPERLETEFEVSLEFRALQRDDSAGSKPFEAVAVQTDCGEDTLAVVFGNEQLGVTLDGVVKEKPARELLDFPLFHVTNLLSIPRC